MTAKVTSTGADATLSVLDSSTNATGRLVNGAYALLPPLQVRANAARSRRCGATTAADAADWTRPVSADNVTLGFKQSIGATECLRTGAYSKTLTFTLSTTTP